MFHRIEYLVLGKGMSYLITKKLSDSNKKPCLLDTLTYT